jgi:hypothetical protein
MLASAMMRVVAVVCGIVGALSAAATAAVLFGWVVDGSRPISFEPLLLSGCLAAIAGVCFVIRHAMLHWLATRPKRSELTERAV